jgi:hypothetical protein
MSAYSGPEIANDGLVLHYDAANSKSYNPNLLEYGHTFDNGYWTIVGVSFDSTTELAPDGTNTAVIMRDDNASAYEYVERNITIPNDNSIYRFSYYLKKAQSTIDTAVNARLINGTTVEIYPRVAADGTGNGLYTLTDRGDWWQVSFTLTNNTSGNTTLQYRFYPAARNTAGDDATVTGANTVWGFMVTRGTEIIEYQSTFNNTPDSIVNLLGDGNNATLRNAGSFSPTNKGSFSYLAAGFETTTNAVQNISASQITAMTWVQVDGHGNFHNFIRTNWVNSGWIIFTTTTNWQGGIAQTGTQYTTGTAHNNSTDWTHLALVYDAVNVLFYVNGSLVGTNSGAPNAILDTGHAIQFGGAARPSTYKIANTMVYNRGLSAAEVLQNYNATKGRYGI